MNTLLRVEALLGLVSPDMGNMTMAPQDEPSLVTRTLQLAGEYSRYSQTDLPM